MYRAAFTKEALEILTQDQIEAVRRLIGDYHTILVSKAFDTGKDWLDFTLNYHDHLGADNGTIWGGISPEGRTHT